MSAIKIFILLLFTVSANASVVSWTLSNVILSDGQTVTGGFDYDADTDAFSNISITNSGNDSYPSTDYAYYHNGGIYNISVSSTLSPTTGDTLLSLGWLSAGPLTNAGGTLALNPGLPFGECTNSDCSGVALNLNGARVASGSISSVPIPAAVWLFGSGLLGLVGIARRKKAA